MFLPHRLNIFYGQADDLGDGRCVKLANFLPGIRVLAQFSTNARSSRGQIWRSCLWAERCPGAADQFRRQCAGHVSGLLFDVNQLAGVKTELFSLRGETRQQFRLHSWSAGQQPEVGMIRARDKGVLVLLLVQLEDDVGRLLTELGTVSEPCAMIMDRAYEGDETRKLVSESGSSPVTPPKSSRTEPWEYDKELYKKRNEVERLFRRLKGFRRIFTRFDKLDVIFIGFVLFCPDRDRNQIVLTGPIRKGAAQG
jgi:transposase